MREGPKRREHRKSKRLVPRRGLLSGQATRAICPGTPPAINALYATLGAQFADPHKPVGQPSINPALVVALWRSRFASAEAKKLAEILLSRRGPLFREQVEKIQMSDTFNRLLAACPTHPFPIVHGTDSLRLLVTAIAGRYGRTGWVMTARALMDWIHINYRDCESLRKVSVWRVRRACVDAGLILGPGKRGPRTARP
jgi:hypothetical protein